MVGERAPLLRTAQPGHSHSEEERVSPFVSLARRRRQPVSLSPFFFATAQRPTLLSLPRNHGGAQSRHQGGRHDGRDAAGRGRLRGPGESEGKRGWEEVLLLLPNARRFGKKERGGGARGRAEGGRTSSWVPFRPRARAQALALGLPLRALAAVCGPRARKAKKRDGPAPAPPLAPPPPRRADPPHTPPLFSCRFSPPRPSTSTPSRRTSPPLSRRSLTRSTRPPGTAWWGATLVRGKRRRGEVGGERGDQRVRGRARAWGAQPAPHGGFSLLFLFTPRLLRHPRDQALYLLLHRCVHGARRDEGRCCEGERENAAHDLPTCSHPPPFFFSISRALSILTGQYAVLLFKSG